mgnify:CR=1 FL=1
MNRIDGFSQVQFQARGMSVKRREYIQRKAAAILNQNLTDITGMSKNASEKRMYFLDRLVDKYNQFNFYRKPEEIDDSKAINTIFQNIKKPKQIHYDLVERFSNSFSDLAKVLTDSNGDLKTLQFVKQLNDEVLKSQDNSSKTLAYKLLESSFKNEYVKKYSDIKPFLILNKDNPDAVKQLDALFESRTYDKASFQMKLDKKKIQNEFSLKGTDVLNKDVYFEIYNQYTSNFMQSLSHHLGLTEEMLKSGADKDILKSLQTLNKNNLNLRKNLLRAFDYSFHSIEDSNRQETYAALVRIFEKADNDKHTKRFLEKSLVEFVNYTPQQIGNVLNNVSTKQLDIFRKNAWKIIHSTKEEERNTVLKQNIKDPFYDIKKFKAREYKRVAYGFGPSYSIFKKAYLKIENCINILKDKLTSEAVSAKTVSTDAEKTFDAVSENTAKQSNVNVLAKNVKEIQKEHTSPKALKRIVANNVLNLVTPKLGAKTLSKQSDLYTKNATKMRLGMLPEIFASVTDTRKADRAVGKRKICSANQDVLGLYLRINGNNKKFVNYLLKKRNVDNTRMFEIKDIIAMIDKAETKIAKEKKLNPEYKARDARKYYNHLYEAKIEQYGKVKPQRKLKTNA